MTSLSRETVTTTTHRILIPNRAAIDELQMALAWAQNTAEEFDKDTTYGDWARVVAEDDYIVIEIVTDEDSSKRAHPSQTPGLPADLRTYEVTYHAPIKRSADTTTETTTVQVDLNNDPCFRRHLIEARHKMPRLTDDEVTTEALSTYLATQLHVPGARITAFEEVTG